MRNVTTELKALRLHGMAQAWDDLNEPGKSVGIDTSRWLIEHLLLAESTDRAMRSISNQMHAAKFPVHRDLAGFDFDVSPVDRKLIHQLAALEFTEEAHNAVFVGRHGHREDASGNRHWYCRDYEPQQTGPVLLNH